MGNFILNLALAHKDYFLGILTGFAVSKFKVCFDYVFDLAMGFKPVRDFALKYADQEEDLAQQAADEFKKKLEEEKAKEEPKP